MKKNQLKLGTILSYGQMALGAIVGLAYTPVMLNLLGQSEYGLYNTVSSTIAMLSVLKLGFNAGYIRNYSKYKKEGNNEAISKLNGLFLLIFTIIGIVGFACGLFLSFNLDFVFDKGLTMQEYETARVLMIMLTISLAISFPTTVFTSIISAHEKFVFLKLLDMIRTVFGPLVTLPLLLAGYGSVGMVAATVSLSLIVDVIYFLYVVFVLKNRFVFHDFEKGLFKSLFAYTFFIALNIIVDQINSNVDKAIIARYRGTVGVSIYSIGYTIYNYYKMFSTSISGVFTPRVHKIIVEADDNVSGLRKRLTELFVKIGRIQFLVLGLVLTGLIFFGYEFIVCFWAGPGYEDSFVVLLLLAIPVTIPMIQNIGIEMQRAQNKHRFRSVAYTIMAVINLVSSIFLCKAFGPIGSAIGTAVAFVLANGIIMNVYYHKRCNIDILTFWKNILRVSIGLIIPVAIGIGIRYWLDLTNIWFFILGVVLYTIVYCISMWFLGMNKYEKSLVLRPIKKILRKK